MEIRNSAFVANLKGGFEKYVQFVRKFIYSDYYLLTVTFFTFLGWVTKCAPFGLSAFIILACLVLIAADDVLPLTINMFAAMLLIYVADLNEFIYMWPMLIPLIICIGIFIARNCRHKFSLGKMFFPQIAVSLALLLGGIGVVSTSDYMRALPNDLILGFGVLVIYVFYNHFLKRNSRYDINAYFARTLMYIGLVISLELIVTILRSGAPMSQWHNEYWDLGWGTRNNIATFLILTAGLTFYLSTKSRYGWIYLAAGFFQYFCIVMTFSRGGIIFGAISGVIALVLSIVKSPNRKHALITTGVMLGVVLLLYLIFMNKINSMISALLARGMDSSGRFDLYKEAWELFKAHPFQGGGMGFVGNSPYVKPNLIGLYWLHSTLFQVIGSMGIIGIIAYLYYYITRFYVLFKNIKDTFNLFILAIWIGFEGYCMIDTGTFAPLDMMLIAVMIILLERNMDNKSHLTKEVLASEYVAQNVKQETVEDVAQETTEATL